MLLDIIFLVCVRFPPLLYDQYCYSFSIKKALDSNLQGHRSLRDFFIEDQG